MTTCMVKDVPLHYHFLTSSLRNETRHYHHPFPFFRFLLKWAGVIMYPTSLPNMRGKRESA